MNHLLFKKISVLDPKSNESLDIVFQDKFFAGKVNDDCGIIRISSFVLIDWIR
jgi:hypothetical protein